MGAPPPVVKPKRPWSFPTAEAAPLPVPSVPKKPKQDAVFYAEMHRGERVSFIRRTWKACRKFHSLEDGWVKKFASYDEAAKYIAAINFSLLGVQ
jgi:hypothetical protein